MLRKAGRSWAASVALSDAAASDFDAMDRDGGGYISLKEFVAWLEAAETLPRAPPASEQDLQRAQKVATSYEINPFPSPEI